MCKEINRLEIVMPNTEIPEWWDYRDQGGIPIFWARGKFPIVALVFVFGKINYQAVRLHLFIDGDHVMFYRQQLHNFTVAEDHVLLCDLRVLFRYKEWERIHARFGHDNGWKSVQVNCETDMILRQWGVYVYKQETSMDDIQFTCPYPESSGTRMLLVAKNNVTGPRDEEMEEERSETTSSYVEGSLLRRRPVRRIVPPHNLMPDVLTATDDLDMEHHETHEEARRRIMKAAQSYSAVAVLVAAVVFAASCTIPDGSENGTSVFFDSRVSLFFTVSHVVALMSSEASVAMFLSILTSPFELRDKSLPRKLSLGFALLFFSLVCTMLASSAAMWLTIRLENKKWTSILIYGAGFIPVAIFAWMQFPLYKMVQRLFKRLSNTLKQVVPTTLINYFKRGAQKTYYQITND